MLLPAPQSSRVSYQAETPACSRAASMSSAPPQALCHSAGAGYTLCLCVIPSDSAGARGQTCSPQHSLHKQAPITQKTHDLSLSSLSPPLSLLLSLFIFHCGPLL